MSVSTCSVCIGDIFEGSSFSTDPCNHMFHRDCLQIWLNDHDTCPNCRVTINRHTECPIINQLREKQVVDQGLILDLKNEVCRMYEQVVFLETMSIFNIPWYTDKLIGITYAIIPDGLEITSSVSSTIQGLDEGSTFGNNVVRS